MKHRCKGCGFIYNDEKETKTFDKLSYKYKCPICKGKKEDFEISDEFTTIEIQQVINSDVTPYNAVIIRENNPSIERIEGCINCGICTKTCLQRENIPGNDKCLDCVGCGQCILNCPKKVLQPKNDLYKFFEAKKNKKICVAYVAPASRISIGEAFGYKEGSFLPTKLVGILKKMGFNYVFDMTFGADMTIMEEAYELVERIKSKEKLPLITSCCPSWVRYAEKYFPEVLENLSTCKSPMEMEGALVKSYFAKEKNIDPKNIYAVAITPCTAKKWEIYNHNYQDTDLVITVSQLIEYIRVTNINFNKIKNAHFDKILGKGSTSGLIFGASGGVMEASLRTAYYYITHKNPKNLKITSLRGYNNLKECEVKIKNYILKVAVVDEMSKAVPILESIKNNTCKYDFIEIMNCAGGCAGGGGQPYHRIREEEFITTSRMSSLYKKDSKSKINTAHDNPYIKKIYNNYLEYPGSNLAKKILHRNYQNKKENN